jgi:hypothetical protein
MFYNTSDLNHLKTLGFSFTNHVYIQHHLPLNLPHTNPNYKSYYYNYTSKAGTNYCNYFFFLQNNNIFLKINNLSTINIRTLHNYLLNITQFLQKKIIKHLYKCY